MNRSGGRRDALGQLHQHVHFEGSAGGSGGSDERSQQSDYLGARIVPSLGDYDPATHHGDQGLLLAEQRVGVFAIPVAVPHAHASQLSLRRAWS